MRASVVSVVIFHDYVSEVRSFLDCEGLSVSMIMGDITTCLDLNERLGGRLVG
jgi:hypothetical protein